MRWPGRIAAACEILSEVLDRHRPASEALKDWAKAHRFAGSTDRHAIGTLVFDALRRKASMGWRMGGQGGRALALGTLRFGWHWTIEAIDAASRDAHGIVPPDAGERGALESTNLDGAPEWVRGDYPEFLAASFSRAFGASSAEQGEALAERAPIDLRCNTLVAERPKLIEALARFEARATPLSPWGVRIAAPGPGRRPPNVEAEPAHGMGWFEVQDEASQIAALLTAAWPGERMADICAGAGGKTLALAAMMRGEGSIVAHDADRHRLRPIFDRLRRAGATNVVVLGADRGRELDAMAGSFDCVLVDAPCSGSGSWRRKPDSKWRLSERSLAQRMKDQDGVLARGARLVRPGGRLVYVTCSVLPEENRDRVDAFLKAAPGFAVVPYEDVWRAAIGGRVPAPAQEAGGALLLTPLNHGTDGFFICAMRRAP